MKEYSLFDGRYNVVIGDRGGVEVYSKATRKPLKVYGRKTNGIRFVNLTPEKREGVFIEHDGSWVREYKKACFYKTSNGFLKFCYYVTIYNETDQITTTGKTKVFTDKSQIVIRDLSSLPDDVLKVITEEKKKRKRWKEYCEALRIDSECPDIKASEYYQQGFETW